MGRPVKQHYVTLLDPGKHQQPPACGLENIGDSLAAYHNDAQWLLLFAQGQQINASTSLQLNP